jgi:hypothetical protein
MSEPTSEDTLATAGVWGYDMALAILERPKWMRPFLRLFMGRYAFREFVGMCRTINKYYSVGDEYWCHDNTYHKEAVTWGSCYETPTKEHPA